MVVSVVTWMYVAFIRDDPDASSKIAAVVTEDDLQQHLGIGQAQDLPRNRVEAVQNVLDLHDEDHEAGRQGGLGDQEDNAKEQYEDEKMYDEDEDHPHNEGGEDEEDDEEIHEKGAEEEAVDIKKESLPRLPPADGSLVFGGPQNDRQRAVVEAFQHAWKGYKTYAWGHDHLRPISKGAQNWFGLGLTLIDSLDTMWIMNLTEDFDEAKEWVAENLTFKINKDVNLFETTIRVLGGLLSAFHLSADNVFLERAKDLGQRLMGAFSSSSGIPYSDVNLKSTRGHAPKWSPDSSTSEVTTLQLEFRDLSRCTDEPQYEEAVAKISDIVHSLEKTDGKMIFSKILSFPKCVDFSPLYFRSRSYFYQCQFRKVQKTLYHYLWSPGRFVL